MARVSKKTKPRRRPVPAASGRPAAASGRPAAASGRPAAASGREDPGTLVERMVSSLWTVIGAGDLLRAELEAATCMALPRVGRLEPGDAQAFISKVLVDEAV